MLVSPILFHIDTRLWGLFLVKNVEPNEGERRKVIFLWLVDSNSGFDQSRVHLRSILAGVRRFFRPSC